MTDSMQKFQYIALILCSACAAVLFVSFGILPFAALPPQPPERENTATPRPETAADAGTPDPSKGNTGLPTTTVRVGAVSITAEIAATPEERGLGLSHRQSLADHTGMLFIFTHDAPHPFWMRDTFIPLDIIWLDAEKRAVHIAHAVAPETYPETFVPPVPARYALEVPAGYAEANGIAAGDRFRWEYPPGEV